MVKKILFLCGHNAGRSQMAEAYFNKYNRNEGYNAESAGNEIAENINPTCAEILKNDGIDLLDKKKFYPKKATKYMVDNAYKVYTMGCNVKLPFDTERAIEDWDLEDPAKASPEAVEAIASEIKNKVLNLIGSLGKKITS